MSTMGELRAVEELDALSHAISTGNYCNTWNETAVEGLLTDLRRITEVLKGETGYTELYHITKNMDNRLQNIETLVETVAKEVAPIVAELADSPIIKMLTGGKKRV